MPADPLTEALVLLTAWLDGDETCATLQRARAWVDARRSALAAPTYQRFVGVDHGDPGGSYEVVVERRPDGTFVLPLGLPAAAPPVERRNCWTCRHAFKEARRCRQLPDEAVAQWVNATHGDSTIDGSCPPDADGCPGWSPTDPPPSADYVGPGWADGVPRG